MVVNNTWFALLGAVEEVEEAQTPRGLRRQLLRHVPSDPFRLPRLPVLSGKN